MTGCAHSRIYYDPSADNFYCRRCKKGMGDAYYQLAMTTRRLAKEIERIWPKPKVVVMCGSSRFVQEMAVCEWMIERDELAVTMGLNLLPWWYDCPPDHLAEAEGCADQMDKLHLRKIDLADEIFVVDADVDGKPYIGSSCANEIAYAIKNGVHVRYFSDEPFIRNHVYEQLAAGIERHKQMSQTDTTATDEAPDVTD